jgi:hypothetical protein
MARYEFVYYGMVWYGMVGIVLYGTPYKKLFDIPVLSRDVTPTPNSPWAGIIYI